MKQKAIRLYLQPVQSNSNHFVLFTDLSIQIINQEKTVLFQEPVDFKLQSISPKYLTFWRQNINLQHPHLINNRQFLLVVDKLFEFVNNKIELITKVPNFDQSNLRLNQIFAESGFLFAVNQQLELYVLHGDQFQYIGTQQGIICSFCDKNYILGHECVSLGKMKSDFSIDTLYNQQMMKLDEFDAKYQILPASNCIVQRGTYKSLVIDAVNSTFKVIPSKELKTDTKLRSFGYTVIQQTENELMQAEAQYKYYIEKHPVLIQNLQNYVQSRLNGSTTIHIPIQTETQTKAFLITFQFKINANLDIYAGFNRNKLVVFDRYQVLEEIDIDFDFYPGFCSPEYCKGKTAVLQHYFYQPIINDGHIYLQIFNNLYEYKDRTVELVCKITGLNTFYPQNFINHLFCLNGSVYASDSKQNIYKLEKKFVNQQTQIMQSQFLTFCGRTFILEFQSISEMQSLTVKRQICNLFGLCNLIYYNNGILIYKSEHASYLQDGCYEKYFAINLITEQTVQLNVANLNELQITMKLWSGNNLNEQWLEKYITDQHFIESISANERMNDLYLQQQWQNQVQLNSQIQKLCKFNSIHKHVRTQFSLQSQLFSGQVSGLEASLKYKMTQCNCTLQNINQQISELSNRFVAYCDE
ncbi:Conserved_hypothetical protein [Hexamita inflata]|uniref:Uncharacterized protein n=1 Tax=Hexamita inflata TaxID=28002 RepID=A0ABP1HH51_9EUKA